MKFFYHLFLIVLLSIALLSCTSVPEKFNANKSYLSEPQKKSSVLSEIIEEQSPQGDVSTKASDLVLLSLLEDESLKTNAGLNLTELFSETELVTLTADNLAIKDYLHYVFGELLSISYVLGEQISSSSEKLTLNVQNKISKRKLFKLSEQVLNERGIVIRFEDEVFYIHKSDANSSGSFTYGYGNKVENVPSTSGEIIQLAPFFNGMQPSLASTIKQLTQVDARVMFEQNAIMIKGKHSQIVKALEFMQLMDQPGFRSRTVGLYKAIYMPVEELSEKLVELLKQEGISASLSNTNEKAVSIVTVDRISTIVFFANNRSLLSRVSFWLKNIDQPAEGNKQQYFVYVPEFARAIDLGQSLEALLGNSRGNVSNSTSAARENNSSAPNNQQQNNNGGSSVTSVNREGMQMVVDERSNSIIFYTSGDEYRQLLPMIKRLDVMPKQVVLEVMIAEVKLTDVFKQGVELALNNSGTSTTVGGFKAESNSAGFSYLLTGARGSFALNLLQTNSNVNVLSRPTLAVRDGVSASINVGDDIPTVGDVITDPVNGSRTSVVYRKTGIELEVRPTVNAKGVILMEISQKISNQASGGSSVEGAPVIFERSISTEVVAENGQTVMLGGLISENRTVNDRSVPFFSSIPLLGALFDSTDDNKDKTELVVMVTPRVIESSEEWDNIKKNFVSEFSNLNINQ